MHKELHNHGQAIVVLTITLNQLAKAQLQQVQNPRQVNAMEGVNMLVNKRRQQNQGNSKQFDDNCDGFQNDGYDEQSEEVQYVNNYQSQRGNSSNQQQWRPQDNWGNQQQNSGNWGNNNQNNNWGNQNNNQSNQGNWNGNNNN